MNRSRWILIALSIAVIGALVAIGRTAQPPLQQPAGSEETVQARVIAVLDEGSLEQGDIQQPFAQTINREFIAEEVVRTLVGSLGLVASVPITTFLASVVFRGEAHDGSRSEAGRLGHAH